MHRRSEACRIAKNEPFQARLPFDPEAQKTNWINALCAFFQPTEFDGGVAGVWGCERPGGHRATWTCRRGPRQEKVDGKGFPSWSMASDSFRLNVKGFNRCDACKQPLPAEYVFLVAFTCRNLCPSHGSKIRRRCFSQPASLSRTARYRSSKGRRIVRQSDQKSCRPIPWRDAHCGRMPYRRRRAQAPNPVNQPE